MTITISEAERTPRGGINTVEIQAIVRTTANESFESVLQACRDDTGVFPYFVEDKERQDIVLEKIIDRDNREAWRATAEYARPDRQSDSGGAVPTDGQPVYEFSYDVGLEPQLIKRGLSTREYRAYTDGIGPQTGIDSLVAPADKTNLDDAINITGKWPDRSVAGLSVDYPIANFTIKLTGTQVWFNAAKHAALLSLVGKINDASIVIPVIGQLEAGECRCNAMGGVIASSGNITTTVSFSARKSRTNIKFDIGNGTDPGDAFILVATVAGFDYLHTEPLVIKKTIGGEEVEVSTIRRVYTSLIYDEGNFTAFGFAAGS